MFIVATVNCSILCLSINKQRTVQRKTHIEHDKFSVIKHPWNTMKLISLDDVNNKSFFCIIYGNTFWDILNEKTFLNWCCSAYTKYKTDWRSLLTQWIETREEQDDVDFLRIGRNPTRAGTKKEVIESMFFFFYKINKRFWKTYYSHCWKANLIQ